MTRTRSEYRLSPVEVSGSGAELALNLVTRPFAPPDRDAMAALMLDAYAGTIDDEGEDFDDALEAVDHYLSAAVAEHSFVVLDDERVVAMAFAVVVDGLHYVDPIVVASAYKRRGLGRAAVHKILTSLLEAGVDDVGATITDGNEASEQLFLGLGFSRTGAWG